MVEERPDVERVSYHSFFAVERIPTTLAKALERLTPREQYDRAYRFKRAFQCAVLHDDLPKEQWIKAEEVCTHVPVTCPYNSCYPNRQDTRYLKPHVQEVEKEDQERRKWDNIAVERRR